jgi:hypothetical protein
VTVWWVKSCERYVHTRHHGCDFGELTLEGGEGGIGACLVTVKEATDGADIRGTFCLLTASSLLSSVVVSAKMFSLLAAARSRENER